MSETAHGGKRTGAGRPRGPASDAHKRYSEARARKEEALAELREMQAAKLRGELIPGDVVLQRWTAIAATVRQRFLSLPPKMAGICEHKPAREIEHLLLAEVRSILTELSEPVNYTDAPQ